MWIFQCFHCRIKMLCDLPEKKLPGACKRIDFAIVQNVSIRMQQGNIFEATAEPLCSSIDHHVQSLEFHKENSSKFENCVAASALHNSIEVRGDCFNNGSIWAATRAAYRNPPPKKTNVLNQSIFHLNTISPLTFPNVSLAAPHLATCTNCQQGWICHARF